MNSAITRRSLLAGLCLSPAWGVEWAQSSAFPSFYNLDYDTAIEALERESRQMPDEPGAFNHLAYGLLYRALFRAEALEGAIALSPTSFLRKPKVLMDAGDRARFDLAIERSRELSRRRLAKNPDSGEALYTLGVAEVHQANLLFLIEKQWRPALRQASEARRLHALALQKDKNLVDAMLVPSVHEYVMGSLPFFLKAVGYLVGYRGDREKGAEGIRQVARSGRRARVEARVLAALVEQREHRYAPAWQIMKGLAEEFPSNHLYRMETVNLLTTLKRHEEAEREAAQLSDKRYRFLRPARLEAFRQQWNAKRKA